MSIAKLSMSTATPIQALHAQTVPSLNALSAEQRFVLIAVCGVAGNRSANHVEITT